MHVQKQIGKFMEIVFKYILLIFILLCIAYLLLGIATTAFVRYANTFKKLNKSKKIIFLTFDDGIDPLYTPLLLDLLQEHNIKATFFLVTSSIKENLPTLLRMNEHGHLIGLHSFSHKNQILQTPFSIKKDFDLSISQLQTAGIEPGFYRPPWGHLQLFGLYMCKAYRLNMVLWTVIVQDWKKDTTAALLCDKLQSKVHGNAVVCLHDGRGKNEAPLKTISALKKMIPKWKEEGYRFETVDQLYKKVIN